MVDLLRVEANERVDLIDFQFALNEAMAGALREAGANFLTNPNGTVVTWILTGFGMTNPTGKQLTVTKGRALLGRQVSGLTRYGMLTVDGDATKTVDMTALTPGTYNVYVRFEYIDTNSTSRVFWDPAGTGKEFTQTVPTRLQANWSMRVETSSPGSEWTLIGTANNVNPSLALVDMRKLYFEGAVDAAYASGWSSDGGGGANDRNADRQAYGVTDLQGFTAAMRQCLTDIKGRGLRSWYSRDIGGMNLGFDAAPVEDRLAIGDASFYFDYNAGNPQILFAANDYFQYVRGSNRLELWINTAERMRLTQSGMSILGGLNIGVLADAPTADAITFSGGNFVIKNDASNPAIIFDHAGGLEDRFQFTKGGSQWIFVIGGNGISTLNTTEFYHSAKIRTGTDFHTVSGTIITGAIGSYFYNSAAGGSIYCASAGCLAWTAAGLFSISGGLRVGDFTAPVDNQIYAVGQISSGANITAGTYLSAGTNIQANGYIDAGTSTLCNNGDGLFTRGVNVGYDAVPTDNRVGVGDADCGVDFNGGSPLFRGSSTQYLHFDRANHANLWTSGGTPFIFDGADNTIQLQTSPTTYKTPASGEYKLTPRNNVRMVASFTAGASIDTGSDYNVTGLTSPSTGVYRATGTGMNNTGVACALSSVNAQADIRRITAARQVTLGVGNYVIECSFYNLVSSAMVDQAGSMCWIGLSG